MQIEQNIKKYFLFNYFSIPFMLSCAKKQQNENKTRVSKQDLTVKTRPDCQWFTVILGPNVLIWSLGRSLSQR